MNHILKGYENAVCEIKTMENELIFHGRIVKTGQEGNKDFIEVRLRRDDTMPLYPYGTRVKIDCIGRRGIRSLGGVLYIANEGFWRLTDLDELSAIERRGFFRINAHGYADVTRGDAPFGTAPVTASLVNVSISGLLFRAPIYLSRGDIINISRIVFDGVDAVFSFKAKVRRVVETSNEKVMLYGCEFVEPRPGEIDRLCGVVFKLQRDAAKKRLAKD